MSVSCDSVCGGGPRIGGTTGFLQLGAAVSQQVRIGGAVHVWWRSGQPDFTSSAVATERLSTLGAVLDYYPAPTSGFFLGCGVGVSGADASSLTGWKQNVIDLGLGLTLR